MRLLISILLVTLCSALCQAQGNDFSNNRKMLEKSREMFEREDYDSALYYLNRAELKPKSKLKSRSELELYADIQEQHCMIQSALGNNLQSNYHRNVYLETIANSKRDNDIDQRAQEIHSDAIWLSWKIILFTISLIAMLLIFIRFKEEYSIDANTGERILRRKDYDLQEEELDEELALLQHKLRTTKEQTLDKRTKLFLINTVSPLIARLRKAIEIKDINYAQEILAQIEQYNTLLTQWIQLEQGKLSFKIETFNINELFKILERNKKTFSLQGLTLNVNTPDSTSKSESNSKSMLVKADKVLTLFMLNTLADNARKATEAGGTIDIYAEEKENYVELSVKDSGKGMTEEQAANIFSHTITNGHGFGLLNCRGIINSYKKVGSLFNCCMIGVESKLGEGSRFFFRLPLVKNAESPSTQHNNASRITRYALITAFCLLQPAFCIAQEHEDHNPRYNINIEDSILRRAADFADSAYYANIDGAYDKTLSYVDSVQICLLQTFSDSTLIDNINLDASNEAAIASLALHRWEDYRTYNNIYENILERLSNNTNQEMQHYCEEETAYMDKMKTVWFVANLFFFVYLAAILVWLRYLWVRRRKMVKYREDLGLDDKKSLVKQLEYENESLHISNNILANGLSTIKHETMYYPSRISTLLKTDSNNEEATELTTFYEQLYNNLAGQLAEQKISMGIKQTRVMLSGGIAIRTDKDLYAYLLLQIKKYLGCRQLDITYKKEGIYTDVVITAESNIDADCFSPTAHNIPMLISRQIVRETSGHNSRGNGIIIDGNRIIIRFS